MVTSVSCENCGTQLRLGRELVLKLAGRTGKLTCKTCGTRLRLDGRGATLTVSVEIGHTAAALLSRPAGPASEIAFGAADLESVRPPEDSAIDAAPLLVLPPPLPPESLEPVPSLRELAHRSLSASPKRRSIPPARDTAETLSPVVSEEIEAPLPSSPEAERRLELRAFYDDVELPPPPAPTTVTSRAPRPPQRSKVASLPAAPSEPATRVTVVSSPAVATKTSSRSPWLAVLAAGLLGALTAAPETRAFAYSAFHTEKGPAATPLVKPSLAAARSALSPKISWPTSNVVDAAPVLVESTLAPAGDSVAKQAHSADRSSPKASDLKSLPSAPSSAPADSASAPNDATATAVATSPEESTVVLPPFDEVRASMALKAATTDAGQCRGESDPTGQARVVVTFAPSGRVTTATISGPPFAGTPTGSCIASKFRSIRVEPFAGERVTMTREVVIY